MNGAKLLSRITLLAVVLFGLAVGIIARLNREPTNNGKPTSDSARTNPLRKRDGLESVAAGQALRDEVARLRRGASRDDGRAGLAELSARIATLPKAEMSVMMGEFLRSGADAPTGLGFKVGAGGALNEAPSLRVFLLDELARLDPASAAEVARSILAVKTSPDEWAVAMRNLARVQDDAAGRAFLESKMRELLTHEPWQQEASAGFLEAFDVAVHLGGTNLVPEIAALVRRTDNRAASHAAYLTLDRLVISEPAPMLERFTEDPSLMAGREATRANYFARADVNNAAQRAVLERYLLDGQRTPEELSTFAGLYPNANFMISENLLTTARTPDRATLATRDAGALRVVNEWLAEERFAARRELLERVRGRLERFVRQASRLNP